MVVALTGARHSVSAKHGEACHARRKRKPQTKKRQQSERGEHRKCRRLASATVAAAAVASPALCAVTQQLLKHSAVERTPGEAMPVTKKTPLQRARRAAAAATHKYERSQATLQIRPLALSARCEYAEGSDEGPKVRACRESQAERAS